MQYLFSLVLYTSQKLALTHLSPKILLYNQPGKRQSTLLHWLRSELWTRPRMEAKDPYHCNLVLQLHRDRLLLLW